MPWWRQGSILTRIVLSQDKLVVESCKFSKGLTLWSDLYNAELSKDLGLYIIVQIWSSLAYIFLPNFYSLHPVMMPILGYHKSVLSMQLWLLKSCHDLVIADSCRVYLALLLLSHSGYCLNHGSCASVNYLPTNDTTGSKVSDLRDNYCFCIYIASFFI